MADKGERHATKAAAGKTRAGSQPAAPRGAAHRWLGPALQSGRPQLQLGPVLMCSPLASCVSLKPGRAPRRSQGSPAPPSPFRKGTALGTVPSGLKRHNASVMATTTSWHTAHFLHCPQSTFFFPPPPPSNCSIMTCISNTIGGAAAEEQHSLLKCEDQASILFTSLFWNHLGTGTMQCHSAEPVSTAPEPAALGAKYFPTSEKGLFPFHVRSCQS